jgi:hypothetical protein
MDVGLTDLSTSLTKKEDSTSTSFLSYLLFFSSGCQKILPCFWQYS